MRARGTAVLLLGALLSLASPLAAGAEVPVTLVARQSLGALPVARVVDVRLPDGGLLAGVTWRSGTPAVRVRWHGRLGWGAWSPVEADQGYGTEPAWAPRDADRVQVEVVPGAEPVEGVNVVTVGESTRWSWLGARPVAASMSVPRIGTVITRPEWGADESLRKGKVTEYGPAVTAVVVHHTVDRNDYTAAEVPALLRGIYAYHVKGRGWDDIGYHLLVDRFGRVFEGRRYGLGKKPVIGAHTGGFNTATMGVAMLGDFTSVVPPPETLESVARVGAYAADRWRWDPRARVTLTARDGSPRFKPGTKVTVARMPGHRDLSATACPGERAYPLLGDIRGRAYAHLGPRFVDVVAPTAPVVAGDAAVLAARLTAPATWQVEVRSAYGGLVLATATGSGTAPRMEWQSRLLGLAPLPPGDYVWEMTADDGVHGPSDPVSGTLTLTL